MDVDEQFQAWCAREDERRRRKLRAYLVRLPGGTYCEVRAYARTGALRQVPRGSRVVESGPVQ